jgi:hypothetical protein
MSFLLEEENRYREDINRRIAARDARARDLDSGGTTAGDPAAPESETDDAERGDPDDDEETLPDAESEDAEEAEALPEKPFPALNRHGASYVHLRRAGVDGGLICTCDAPLAASVLNAFAEKFAPRIELINPITNLSDTVSAGELAQGKNEFMRGIFYYAGLNPDASEELFIQNDRTLRRLKKASQRLDGGICVDVDSPPCEYHPLVVKIGNPSGDVLATKVWLDNLTAARVGLAKAHFGG